MNEITQGTSGGWIRWYMSVHVAYLTKPDALSFRYVTVVYDSRG